MESDIESIMEQAKKEPVKIACEVCGSKYRVFGFPIFGEVEDDFLGLCKKCLEERNRK